MVKRMRLRRSLATYDYNRQPQGHIEVEMLSCGLRLQQDLNMDKECGNVVALKHLNRQVFLKRALPSILDYFGQHMYSKSRH